MTISKLPREASAGAVADAGKFICILQAQFIFTRANTTDGKNPKTSLTTSNNNALRLAILHITYTYTYTYTNKQRVVRDISENALRYFRGVHVIKVLTDCWPLLVAEQKLVGLVDWFHGCAPDQTSRIRKILPRNHPLAGSLFPRRLNQVLCPCRIVPMVFLLWSARITCVLLCKCVVIETILTSCKLKSTEPWPFYG